MKPRLGLVGARGYTGREILRLLAAHDGVELALASSASAAGEPVPGFDELRFVPPAPALLDGLDAAILALPNGASGEYVDCASDETVLIDLSADHRFDEDWAYGLPEHNRAALRGARRVANPGCYATGAQLALAPLAQHLEGEPAVFGVSGYSGAGITPSRKNDPEVLTDNLLPYALQGHVHEREVSHRLGRRVRFHPHVAPWFQGISLTVSGSLRAGVDAAELLRRAYADEALVEVQGPIPEVKAIAGRPGAVLGGLSSDDEGRFVVVCVLDNLLKGAAVQAVQNLNLALGLDERMGLSP